MLAKSRLDGVKVVTQYFILLPFQVVDGYFVHFFAPSGLEPVDKNVLFVLDVSGSMGGQKITQTKDAMKEILSDLRPGDMFNIITFSTSLKFWHGEGLLPATRENIRGAKEFVKEMKADGGDCFPEFIQQVNL
jgi:hypothetical protein